MPTDDDWWSRKLGGQPRQQPTAYAQPPQNDNSWANPHRHTITQPAGPPQKVTIDNLGQMLGQWRGGEGARNSTHCPECGSDQLFRRKVGASEAAPLCYSCGYNGGMFRQGDPAVWSA